MTQRPVERNEEGRWRFLISMTTVDPLKLVFLDETSTQFGLRRSYAYAPIGQRVHGEYLRNYGDNHSLLSAMSLDGILPSFLVDGSATREVFEFYLERLLIPAWPGQLLILDNYSIHHGGRVEEIVKAAGCDLIYLPVYSPDLNPIELAFSKVKALLKRAVATTFETLSKAIKEALDNVSLTDIQGFFRYVVYWRQYL